VVLFVGRPLRDDPSASQKDVLVGTVHACLLLRGRDRIGRIMHRLWLREKWQPVLFVRENMSWPFVVRK
jgi:hypothetical protein